jgi:hypothetical protein
LELLKKIHTYMYSFYDTFIANSIQKISLDISILSKREDFSDIEKIRLHQIQQWFTENYRKYL